MQHTLHTRATCSGQRPPCYAARTDAACSHAPLARPERTPLAPRRITSRRGRAAERCGRSHTRCTARPRHLSRLPAPGQASRSTGSGSRGTLGTERWRPACFRSPALAGLAWHTHRRLVERVKSADDRSNVRCGAGSAACVRSATCRMQAGNSLACQNCEQVLLHVNAQRLWRRWTGVTGYYRAQYPVGVHLVPCQGEVPCHCGACMAQPSASAHARFQAPRRSTVHVACCSSHACMPHVWALGWCAGPLACCTSCVVCCVLRAAGCALRVAHCMPDGVCCIIACCIVSHTASWSRERSKGVGIQGRWAAETPRRDLPQDGK